MTNQIIKKILKELDLHAVYELPHGMDIVIGTVEETGMQYAGKAINLEEHISQAITQAVEEARKEAFEISDQAILRMQIMAVEACGRLEEDEGVKIVNDIRGKYEQLKEDLDKLTK